MRVTVINELAPQTGPGAQARLRLRALDFTDEDIVFPYLPEAWSEAVPLGYSGAGLLGAQSDALDWSNNAPRTFPFKQVYSCDDYASLTPGGQTVVDNDRKIWLERLLTRLSRWAREPTAQTGEPTRLVATVGSAHQFNVRITALKIDRIRLSPDGYCIVGGIDMVLTEAI
jgi:hypothetical protein